MLGLNAPMASTWVPGRSHSPLMSGCTVIVAHETMSADSMAVWRSSVTVMSPTSVAASASARCRVQFQIVTRSIDGRAALCARMPWGAMAPAPTITRWPLSSRDNWRLPRPESHAVLNYVSALLAITACSCPSSGSNRT